MSNDQRRLLMIANFDDASTVTDSRRRDTGNVAFQALALAEALARFGWNVDICTWCRGSGAGEEPVTRGVRVLRLDEDADEPLPDITADPLSPPWVELAGRFADLADTPYQAILSHGCDAGIAGVALGQRLDVPHLHRPRSLGISEHRQLLTTDDAFEHALGLKHRQDAERRVYTRCDVLLAGSPTMRAALVGDYGVSADKVEITPPGFDDARFFPVSQATHCELKERLGLRGRIVYSCGAPVRSNGFDLLLRAMPVVLARLEDARLVLGIERADATQRHRREIAACRALAAELGIVDRITIGPYPSADELPDHLRAADVFALGVRDKAFGIHAIEAMACGTPTVISSLSGIGEQIAWGLEALTSDPFDAEAFGHTLAAVLQQDRLGGQLARCGSERARAEFTWTEVALRVIRILDAVQRRRQTRVDAELESAATPADAPMPAIA